MYLAYKYVTIAILLSNANFCVERLDLHLQRPIIESSLNYKLVAPPNIISSVGFGGRIDSGQYAFSFGGSPQEHCFITKLSPFGDLSVAEQNEMLSREKSLITTNQAYQLATNWLTLIDVDVQKLGKTYEPEVRQRWFFGDGSPSPKILLPIFYVRWGEWEDAKVEVSVDGRNKEMLELRMMNQDSFSRHPTELIKDIDKLLTIPDEEFLKYSPQEKSNLVARFAVVTYPTFTNELHGSLSQTNAPVEKMPPAKQ